MHLKSNFLGSCLKEYIRSMIFSFFDFIKVDIKIIQQQKKIKIGFFCCKWSIERLASNVIIDDEHNNGDENTSFRVDSRRGRNDQLRKPISLIASITSSIHNRQQIVNAHGKRSIFGRDVVVDVANSQVESSRRSRH